MAEGSQAGAVPVRECAAAAFSFLRRCGVRLAGPGIAAAALASAAGMYLPLLPAGAPPSPLIAPLAPLYYVFVPAIQTAAAIQGLPVGGAGFGVLALTAAILAALAHLAFACRLAADAPPAEPIAAAAARLIGAFAAVGLVFMIFWSMLFIVLMFTFAAALQSLGYDPAALEAIGADQAKALAVARQTLATPAGALTPWALLSALAVGLWLLARLALFVPATVAEGRVLTFRTWAWTRGSALRILAAGALVGAPLLAGCLVVGAALSAVGLMVVGAAPGAISPAGLFVLNFAYAAPLTLLFTPAMVGLSAYLYRGLRPVG